MGLELGRLKSPRGEIVATTNREFNLLVAFLVAPQRVLSRDQLLALSRANCSTQCRSGVAQKCLRAKQMFVIAMTESDA